MPGGAGQPHQDFGGANLGFLEEFLASGTPINFWDLMLKIELTLNIFLFIRRISTSFWSVKGEESGQFSELYGQQFLKPKYQYGFNW